MFIKLSFLEGKKDRSFLLKYDQGKKKRGEKVEKKCRFENFFFVLPD